MKKSLIALAVMAAAGAASAQSSVTLFGIVDTTISGYSVAGGGHDVVLSNSGYNSSRLGFRGTEDLGGGMAASFWLEAGVNSDNGSGGSTAGTGAGGTGGGGLTFNRRSTVSLSGGWGELRLGRDYTPVFWNITLFDPFGTNGVGTTVVHKAKTTTSAAPFGAVPVGTAGRFGANDGTAVRSSNMVGYFLPANLGGIYGQVNYAFDEQQNGGEQGRFFGARLGFGSGPFNVAVAYGRAEGTDSPAPVVLTPVAVTAATLPDVRTWNLGGQWDFGMAKLLASYDRTKYEGGLFGATSKGWLLGALVPVGAGEIRASYSRVKLDTGFNDPRASQWAVGYVHNLSKRTAVYTTYAHVSNRGGSALSVSASLPQGVPGAVNANSSGFDLGIRHSF